MNFINFFQRRNISCCIWIALIIGIAVTIRFKGVWFGYPLPVHPDEPRLVEAALRMIETGDLNPHFFQYPTLNIYLHACLYYVSTIVGGGFGISLPEMPVIWYYIIGRSFNVLISILTIFITFIIGKRLFSPFAGVLAAFFLTFSFLHTTNSYVATVDTSVAFWTSLATLMAVLIYTDKQKLAYYLLGGIFVGFAIGSKYTSFVCIAPLLIAHVSRYHDLKKCIDKKILLCLVVTVVAFLATTPYALLDYSSFLADIQYEARHYSSGHEGAESATSTSYHLYGYNLFFKGYGIMPMIFAGLGLAWLTRKEFWKAAIIVIFPVLFFIFLGSQKVYFSRNLVATTPFLSLLSGFFISAAHKKFLEIFSPLPSRIRAAVVYLILALVLVVSIWHQSLSTINCIAKITLPDTRWVSLEWIQQSLPPGSHIGREHYTPPLEKYSSEFFVEYLGYFAVARKQKAVTALDYMIVSSADYARFIADPERYPVKSALYKKFFKQHELVKEFIPIQNILGGPSISVYKIQSE